MSIELNASQERFAALTRDELRNTDEQRVIFGCGLTGVGKSTVLAEISDEIERNGGKIVTLDFLLDPANQAEIINSERHMVTSFTPRSLEVIQNGHVDRLGLPFVGVRVMAMSPEETNAYIEELRSKRAEGQLPSDLNNEMLAALTMGVYAHINKYFEFKDKGEFYQPSAIREALKADMPIGLVSGPGFQQYLNTLTDLSQLWGQMGTVHR